MNIGHDIRNNKFFVEIFNQKGFLNGSSKKGKIKFIVICGKTRETASWEKPCLVTRKGYSFYSLISNPMWLDLKYKGQSEMLSREVVHMDGYERMYLDW